MTFWQALLGRSRGKPQAPAPTVIAEARSHVGRVRAVNEDRFLLRTDRGLWAVADGMGGHTAGVAAASSVITALEKLTDREASPSDEDIRESLLRSNQSIFARNDGGTGVSGATIVVARHDGDEMMICWAGDSRAYLISQDKARLVTTDHSVVQELVHAGVISETEARDHPQSHVITRALGVKQDVVLDLVRVPFLPGDMLLLCSDGLSRSLAVKDLAAFAPSLSYSADRLLGNALRRDGSDNATLVLIERLA